MLLGQCAIPVLERQEMKEPNRNPAPTQTRNTHPVPPSVGAPPQACPSTRPQYSQSCWGLPLRRTPGWNLGGHCPADPGLGDPAPGGIAVRVWGPDPL